MIDAGEPTVLLGTDSGPNAAEYLLHALAACLTTTIVYCAAARKIRLTEIESTFEADMDVRGCFGLDDGRAQRVQRRSAATFRLNGDASDEKLRALVDARPAALRGVRHAHPRRPREPSTPSPGTVHPRVRASGAEAVPDGRDLVAAHDEPVVGARPAREQPSPVG